MVNTSDLYLNNNQVSKPDIKTGCCGYGVKACLKKYFWEGQRRSEEHNLKLTEQLNHPRCHVRFIAKHRRAVGFLLPVCFVHFIYWSTFISYGRWYLYKEKYIMTLTMVFGGLIAGMTSEGGGAVAYPVLTLAIKATPAVARDVSLMVQACGMSTASFAILFQHIQVEWHSVFLCFAGGAVGALTGFHTLDVWLSGSQKKMGFVTIWFSFAFALFLLNRYNDRKTYYKIHDFKLWKAITLLVTGLIGGLFTSFAGGGLDICSFSMLTLLFRVTEKVATPTSVLLMASNSCLCFYWRVMVMRTMSQEALDYIAVTAPVVTLMAPIGATLGSHFPPAFIIIPMNTGLVLGSLAVIVVGFGIFTLLTWLGERTIRSYEAEGRLDKETEDKVAHWQENGNVSTSSAGHDNSGYVSSGSSFWSVTSV
ncbi:hypothetical protein LSAT2_001217 [Lamellibrachia satsuma]|nr:hypothetical protein LSAT2_001217 [Lamellibrachia satsuma]